MSFIQNIINRSRRVLNPATRYQTIGIPDLGKINRNQRLYTKEALLPFVDDVANQNMFGQIGYPDSADISLKRASHHIHKVFLVGQDLWVEYSILDNENGLLLYDLLQTGEFVLRPRGTGIVQPDGSITNYKLISFDFIPIEEDAFKTLENEGGRL